jgi:hypothetical protein
MAMTLITTNTHTGDSDSTSSFTSSIDSTYKLYIFKFYDINPTTDNADFLFNGSIDGGSNYNVTKTNTFFKANHPEDDSTTNLEYSDLHEVAESTAFIELYYDTGGGGDESGVGEMFLFNPSSTTYVKHFYSTFQHYHNVDQSWNTYVAGCFNTTDNIDAVQFKMSTGNMDGVIKMYGVG